MIGYLAGLSQGEYKGLQIPLRRIRVVPLAFESFGVRSMCTYVETMDVKVIIDPGVSLGPRFRLLPHPREYKALQSCRRKVAAYAGKADVATASHYHFDHVSPALRVDTVWTWSSREVAREIYQDKLLFVKDVRSNINYNQRKRGWIFTKIIGEMAKQLTVCDGNTFEFGGTQLRFSEPVCHGEENEGLGWVLMLTVTCGDEKVMHCPDVQGPISGATLQRIIEEKPEAVILGGPPSYLTGFKVSYEVINQGIHNLVKLTDKIPILILDHHLLRDENWRQLAHPVFKAARLSGCKVFTAAESISRPNKLLESQRRKLYELEPPSQEFQKWTKLPRDKRREIMPPI